jgi:hypothetical protein
LKLFALTILATLTCGCLGSVKVAPVTVEPIHVTIDVNVHDQRDVSHPNNH